MISKEIIYKAIDQIKSGAEYNYFFNKINSPEWILPLRDKGLFKNAPGLKREGELISCQYWPESQFLVRVADKDPKTVCDTILSIAPTDNYRVRTDYLSAACKMPVKYAVKIAEKEITFVKNSERLVFLYPDEFAKLIQHIAINKELKTSVRMLSSILAVIPTPRKENENQYLYRSYTPKTDYYDYGEILSACCETLLEHAPVVTFPALCNLLKEIMVCKSDNNNYDYSHLLRPAIEDHEQNSVHSHDIDSLLVSKIRDFGNAILTTGDISVFETLRHYQHKIFKRIELYLRSKWFAVDSKGASDFIFSIDFKEEINLHHELFNFLQDHFSELHDDAQKHYKKHVKSLISFEDYKKRQTIIGVKDTSEENWKHYKRLSEYRRLLPISKYLVNNDLKRFNDLKEEFDTIIDHPSFLSYTGECWTGPTSPIEENLIENMSVPELLEYINKWQPTNDDFSPSPEGLGRKISTAIKKNPNKFTIDADKFINSDPTYIKSFFWGIRDSIRDNIIIENWEKIIALAKWAIEQNDDGIQKKKTRLNIDADYGWQESRNTIASTFEDALRVRPENNLAFELRDSIWKILLILSEDDDPNKEKEYSVDGTGLDEYSTSINTVRGNALHGIFTYALWVMDYLIKQGKKDTSFKDMEEVKLVLENHLDTKKDSSLAIRAVYGKWFPWTITLDKNWALSQIDNIFPKDEKEINYFQTAWNAYCYNSYYSTVFDALKDVYLTAIKRWSNFKFKSENLPIELERLLSHLGIAYLRGEIPIDDELLTVATSINEFCAAKVMNFFGRFLYFENKGKALEPKFEKLLVEYWRHRIDNNASEKELSEFDLWFKSGKLNKEWTITSFEYVLNRISEFKSRHGLMENFITFVEDFPLNTIRCIRLLLEKDKNNMLAFDYRGGAKDVLAKLLENSDPSVKKEAVNLVHLFGAKGNLSFRELLNG